MTRHDRILALARETGATLCVAAPTWREAEDRLLAELEARFAAQYAEAEASTATLIELFGED